MKHIIEGIIDAVKVSTGKFTFFRDTGTFGIKADFVLSGDGQGFKFELFFAQFVERFFRSDFTGGAGCQVKNFPVFNSSAMAFTAGKMPAMVFPIPVAAWASSWPPFLTVR